MRELLRVKGVPASVRVVNLAGELLITPLVDRIYAESGVAKVYDLYGPTETTTHLPSSLRQAGEPPIDRLYRWPTSKSICWMANSSRWCPSVSRVNCGIGGA